MEQQVPANPTRGQRHYFLIPEVERVLAVTMTIAQELAVARARIDTLERLLERKGLLAQAEVESFEPTPAEAAAWSQSAEEYIARVLGVLQRELEQIGSASAAESNEGREGASASARDGAAGGAG
jgi:predicted NAD/FAD-binding protein